jgi:hypothetical protein
LVIGSVELVPLVDAVGLLGELDDLYPGVDDWEPYRALYPELFSGSQWRVPCTSYLGSGVTAVELVFLKHKPFSPLGTMRVCVGRTRACVSETQSPHGAA